MSTLALGCPWSSRRNKLQLELREVRSPEFSLSNPVSEPQEAARRLAAKLRPSAAAPGDLRRPPAIPWNRL